MSWDSIRVIRNKTIYVCINWLNSVTIHGKQMFLLSVYHILRPNVWYVWFFLSHWSQNGNTEIPWCHGGAGNCACTVVAKDWMDPAVQTCLFRVIVISHNRNPYHGYIDAFGKIANGQPLIQIQNPIFHDGTFGCTVWVKYAVVVILEYNINHSIWGYLIWPIPSTCKWIFRAGRSTHNIDNQKPSARLPRLCWFILPHFRSWYSHCCLWCPFLLIVPP